MKKGDWILIGAIVAVVAAVLFFSLDEGSASVDSVDVEVVSDVSYAMAEVEAGNVAENCLVVFEGGVYDLTAMIAAGKHKPIDSLCGSDITESGAHGDYLGSKLEKYYVGELE